MTLYLLCQDKLAQHLQNIYKKQFINDINQKIYTNNSA